MKMLEICIYLAVMMLIGAVICFFGKRLYFPMMMLSTFLLSVSFFLKRFGMNWKGILLGAAVGIGLALLVRFVYKAGVFILGAFVGALLGLLLGSLLPQSADTARWIIVAVFMLALGICAVKWCDFFIMFGTAVQGGSTIASGLCFLILNARNMQQFVYADGAVSTISHLQDYIGNELLFQNRALLIGCFILFAVAGFVFQLAKSKKER